MTDSESKDDLLFETSTLRLMIGILAFAFPAIVATLTGKITNSISASYYEPESRDVFVGFLFIMGALLIAYKGHIQEVRWNTVKTRWTWMKTYQEDLISAVGGLAAIFTALYPTARTGGPREPEAVIHAIGAGIMFSAVVYFCLIAFLRSANMKLIEHLQSEKRPKAEKPRDVQKDVEAQNDPEAEKKSAQDSYRMVKRLEAHIAKSYPNALLRVLWYPAMEMRIFRKAVEELSLEAIVNSTHQRPDAETCFAERQAVIRRGRIYSVCGTMITLTLLGFVVMAVGFPGWVEKWPVTFVVETIALIFFGLAWMTASKAKYLAQALTWLKGKWARMTAHPTSAESVTP